MRVYGRPQISGFDKLRLGVTLEGIKYKPIQIELERQTGSNAWLNIALREGKNREIRKLMDSIDLQVNRLIYSPVSRLSPLICVSLDFSPRVMQYLAKRCCQFVFRALSVWACILYLLRLLQV